MSSKSNKLPNTLSGIAAMEAQLAASMKELADAKSAIAAEENEKLANVIKAFPGQVEKVMGRTGVTFSEVISLIKKVETGTLGKLASTVDTSRRLTKEEREQLVSRLVQRFADIKAGKTPEQISAIANAFSVTAQTVHARKEEAQKAFEASQVAPAAPATA